MAILASNDITNGKPVAGFGAGGGQVRCERTFIDLPSVVTTSDSIRLFYLPPHATVLSGGVKVADLDSGSTVTLNVGDLGGYDTSGAIAADPDRYFSAITTAQAGGVNTTMAATGVMFYTGARKVEVQATLAAGPSTTAGRLEVWINYTVEEPQGRP